MGKQMIEADRRTVHSSTSREVNWHSIDWKKAGSEVRKLQIRIAPACFGQEGS